MIYIARNWEQEGPFPEEEVQRMMRAEELPAGTLYWQEGMTTWRPLNELFVRTITRQQHPLAHGPLS